MDDVFRDVVVTAGDEHLGARDPVIVRALDRHGGRLDVAERAARLRFGQAHGAAPLAAVELLQVRALQVLVAEGKNQAGGAVGAGDVHVRRGVRGVEHESRGGVDRSGELLPAEFERCRLAVPAAFLGRLPDLVHGFRDMRRFVAAVARGALLVHFRVSGPVHLSSQLVSSFQRGVESLSRVVVEILVLSQLFDVQHLVKDEMDVTHVDECIAHLALLTGCRFPFVLSTLFWSKPCAQRPSPFTNTKRRRHSRRFLAFAKLPRPFVVPSPGFREVAKGPGRNTASATTKASCCVTASGCRQGLCLPAAGEDVDAFPKNDDRKDDEDADDGGDEPVRVAPAAGVDARQRPVQLIDKRSDRRRDHDACGNQREQVTAAATHEPARRDQQRQRGDELV